MNKLFFFIGFIGIITITSCANRLLSSNRIDNRKDLSQLFYMMAGEFSSEEQVWGAETKGYIFKRKNN